MLTSHPLHQQLKKDLVFFQICTIPMQRRIRFSSWLSTSQNSSKKLSVSVFFSEPAGHNMLLSPDRFGAPAAIVPTSSLATPAKASQLGLLPGERAAGTGILRDF